LIRRQMQLNILYATVSIILCRRIALCRLSIFYRRNSASL